MKNEVMIAAKLSGIKLKNKSYYPTSVGGDNKIGLFLKNLEKLGFKRMKPKNTHTYEYHYVKGNKKVRYSARFGKGYSAILGGMF